MLIVDVISENPTDPLASELHVPQLSTGYGITCVQLWTMLMAS